MIDTFSLPQLNDLVEREFLNGVDPVESVMRSSPLVVEEPIANNTGSYRRMAERIDIDQYADDRAEGDSSSIAKVQYGYEKDLEMSDFTLQVSITKKMRREGKTTQIRDTIQSLGGAARRRLDLDLAHRFTFAFATSYVNKNGQTVDVTTGDGKALCASDHTLTGSATTYNNIIPANPQFTKAALEAAEKLFTEETYDNLGLKSAMMADTIVTTDDPNTCNQVKELLNSTADVDTNNSGTFNVYSSKYTHVKSGRIATTATGATDNTKAKYWFLACAKKSSLTLGVVEEAYLTTPNAGNNGEDLSSGKLGLPHWYCLRYCYCRRTMD